jgi:hypothetical protein
MPRGDGLWLSRDPRVLARRRLSEGSSAHVLAQIVRLDRAHHRQMAGESGLAEQVKILARSHQTLIWSRQRSTNALRSMLREFYPVALEVFGEDLSGQGALAVLRAAPSPGAPGG